MTVANMRAFSEPGSQPGPPSRSFSLAPRAHYFTPADTPCTGDAVVVAETLHASATIDGEAVCCDDTGVAVFEKLHSRAHDDQAFLYAFDLLELDGQDWRPRSLEERKSKLKQLLASARAGIQFNEHIEGDGATVFAHACKLGLEGIVSKHREHPYRSGPSKAWLKIKNPAAPDRPCYPRAAEKRDCHRHGCKAWTTATCI
jgi:ATP-dependent DNA ligase